MPGILTVVSQKGGVGKTTTAVNLAAALALRGIKTLLVDADPQGAVRHALGLRNESTAGLSDYVLGDRELHDLVLPSQMPWLRVLLAGAVAEDGNSGEYQTRLAASPRLAELVTRAAARGHVVVIDTPPGLGPIARAVLGVSEVAVVPLQSEPLALQTSSQLFRGLRELGTTNPRLALAGILLTMHDADDPVSARVATYVREHFPAELLFDMSVPRSRAVAEAFAAGQPLVVRTPDDPAAQAYTALADQLLARLQ